MPGETILVIDDSPTILRLVQLVLTRAGFCVETAADGDVGLSKARDIRPHLILLDFVMPRVNGYQFCRELAGDSELRQIPVVLMSAKGDQVGEHFVKVMGIVDYITKPFSPEAISAVVHHTLAKYGSEPASAEQARRASERIATDRAEKHKAALSSCRDELSRILAGPVSDLLARAAATGAAGMAPASEDQDAVFQAARSALDDETLLACLRAAEKAHSASLLGDLWVFPIAEVLQLFDAQEQSGVLTVTQGDASVTVHFRRGRIDLATGRGLAEEFRLGRFLLDSELVTQEQLTSLLRQGVPGEAWLGTDLVDRGALTRKDLLVALRRQTCELIYEILRWSSGSFCFRSSHDLAAEANDAALGLEVEGILMEGFRRADEWHLIEREVNNFDLIFLRNEEAVAQLGRARLARDELTVLELVNGKNTVKDIIRRSHLGSFEVSKMLYRLLSIKLIRRRVMPVAV